MRRGRALRASCPTRLAGSRFGRGVSRKALICSAALIASIRAW